MRVEPFTQGSIQLPIYQQDREVVAQGPKIGQYGVDAIFAFQREQLAWCECRLSEEAIRTGSQF
ncbi:hypothetical protein Cmtc_22040 [Cupriavidus sp. TKC]|nr:hypothetical protein D769_03645 [Cupriavidus sp. HMR-1]GMG90984.1 hypothetical protein Cmtc_22040 [Cupriavidus sp. TKC]